MLCHTGTPVRLLPPPGYWSTSFLLSNRSPTRKLQFQRFREVHWDVQNTFSFISVRFIPRIFFRVSPMSPWFLALAFPFFLSFLLPVSCTSQTSLRTSSLWFHPIFLPCLLCYAIPPYSSSPFCYFLQYSYSMSTMAGNLFFGMFVTLFCHFNSLTSLFVSSGYIPSSAIIACCIASRT